jgi:hypothetical protein
MGVHYGSDFKKMEQVDNTFHGGRLPEEPTSARGKRRAARRRSTQPKTEEAS